MSLPRFSVDNSVFVNMLMVVILAGGVLFALTLTREMFPESRPDKIAVTSIYPGVQPEEIEKAVTIKIEESIRDVQGIERVEASVSESMSIVVLTLRNEVKDVDSVLQEVKNEVDALEDLPEGVEQTTIRKLEPKLPVISIALFGAGDEQSRKRAARDLRDDLLRLPGISDVVISGTREDEISVEVRPERLLEYDITFNEVAEAIGQTNLDVSGGQLKGARANVSVRTLGEESRGVDLEDIVVRTRPDGRKVRVSDVAIVRDDFVESDLESYFNGEPAVHCVVYKTGAQDAIQIAQLVKAYLRGKQDAPFDPYGFQEAYARPWYRKPFALAGAWLDRTITRASGRPDPQHYYELSRKNPFDHRFQTALHTDLSRFIEGRLDLMVRNGKSGLVLVLISLMLFLNWRVAFWAAMGMPVAFLGTFCLMWMFGVTINLLSLFGLIIVLGIIVDDAIVIGENIFRHLEEGLPPREAAIKGAEEVMWPVLVAVTTTIAAFVPLMFIQGRIGDFMSQLPLVVIAALSVSLIEALVILPAHLAHMPSKREREERKARRLARGGWFSGVLARWHSLEGRVFDGIAAVYERFLRFALRWRYVTLCVAVGVLFVSVGMVAGGVVEQVFIQKIDSETLVGSLEMPVGTTADQVRARLQTLSDRALELPEVSSVQLHVALQVDIAGEGAVGASMQSHLGQLIIELEAADVREEQGGRSSEEVLTDLRQASQSLSGVNSVTWLSLSGGPAGKDIDVRVVGRDFNESLVVAEKLKRALSGFKGVVDLDDDFDEGKREVQVRLRESARPTGITVGALGESVRSAMYGREARRITRNREDVKIMVRYPENFRTNVYHLESMWIPTQPLAGDRGWVPLGQVAELTETESYTTIHRTDQVRTVRVFGDVEEGFSTTDIMADVGRTFENEIQPAHPGVAIEFLGSLEEQTKAFSSLKVAFPVAMLLVYMLLAGLFRSYAQPLVVMAAIPFGFQGAVLGHWLTGNPITILSYIGLVALTGIVVNDSLVLVNFINQRVRSGMSEFEASLAGARLRLRAIMLTTLTTVAGLTPLMFETSFQAKFLIPMAVTLTFGLAFATVLTLVIVPALNMVFYDVRSLFARGQREVHEVSPPESAREPAAVH